MNIKIIIPFAAFIIFTISFSNSPEIYSYPSDIIAEQMDSVITFDSIKNELSEDGEWIKVNPEEVDSESVVGDNKEFDDELNTDYVWRPHNVDKEWSPYTNGYWRYTNCGWMWFSNYHWGWRPYHYGRWWWSPVWGWVWSPGYVWAPSWVVWMYYGDYWGWYPLSPRVRWHHHHGYGCHHVRFRTKHWTFVEKRTFLHVINDGGMVMPKDKHIEILKKATFASSILLEDGKVTNKGPDVKEYEKSTGEKITAEEVNKYNTKKAVDEIIEKEKKRNPDVEKKVTQEKKTYSDDKKVKKEEEKVRRNETKTNEPTWEYKEPEKKKEPERKTETKTETRQKEPEKKIDSKPNNDTKSNNNNTKKNDNTKPNDQPGNKTNQN
ncbi:MAG: hypothetical protein EHM58_17145 [Ignavibacteriae bacterium]|nr:MAG: hypothetical protein EHM58_17145 [Ignavibacteriota bacterium]